MMMLTITLLLLALAGAASAWALQGRLRDARVFAARVLERERNVLAAVRALLDACRRSSTDVIAAVACAVRRTEPAIDAVAVFVPAGEDLHCAYVDGARLEHVARLSLRRDDDRYLPARAAALGHRVGGMDGVLVPTDRSALAVPMLDATGTLHAVVYASSCDGTALDEDAVVQSVEHGASPYALALERERDRADATYDGLTGLLTARAFRTLLREEIARVRLRAPRVLTLWFVDTDSFKAVNDTYGHAAGDGVLHAMAALLRAHTVQDVDLVARNGGDEFCALIHDAQKTLAIERAHAFCEAVRKHDFGIPLRVTASVGIASYPYDASDANALLETADAAMYHSKRHGRDRVSFAVNGTTFAVFREPGAESAVSAL
jgi:diguanylate cyclase (GGDEF)-like protein